MPPRNLVPPRPHDYERRMRSQMLSWAMGRPYHEPVADECCPDFSCCIPEMFTEDDAERWRLVRKEYEAATREPHK